MDENTRATIQLMVNDECQRTIMQHLTLCPLTTLKIEERVRSVEKRYVALIAFMIGSGLISGATVATILKTAGL